MKKPNLIRSFNSIQSQTFKDLEIIIVDDNSENNGELLQYLFENEPRLRIVTHSKKMGLWRTRIDGFLYSNGEYVIHFDPGDLYEDNYVLEDSYNIIKKYNLDSVKTICRMIYDYNNLTNIMYNYFKDLIKY